MIFPGYFNHTYTVEEISTEKAKYLLAQQLIEKSEFCENTEQLFITKHSYRSNLNFKK